MALSEWPGDRTNQVLKAVSGFERPALVELAGVVADLWSDHRTRREPGL